GGQKSIFFLIFPSIFFLSHILLRLGGPGPCSTQHSSACASKGIGTVQCTPAIKLSSVLHVPAFLVNMLSMSALID
uniref:Uncharacterized protein n=1 Tax=Aegilops tauschii subsp. strangulata TaxID=200361 RepID=A0A453P4T4_AEGTS